MVMASAIVLAVAIALIGIVVPFILAVVGATLFSPLVNALEKRGLARSIGAVLTMVMIVVVVVAIVVMIVWGVTDQSFEISAAISAGVQTIGDWLAESGIDPALTVSIEEAAREVLPVMGQGIAGALGNVFSSAIAFFVGVFFGFFILFFMLKDGPLINEWVGGHISKDTEMGADILADSGHSVRAYFKGTAITATATSTVVIIPCILLDVPLIIPIFIVYFFSSFIPYLGAWIAGAFAVLIALGTGDIQTAAIVAVAVVVSNGMIQSAVSSWAVGGELELHPLVIFLVTIAAGTVGGVTFMIIAAPLAAIIVQTTKRLSEAGALEMS